MVESIKSDDKDLYEIVEILFDISCIQITDYYMKEQHKPIQELFTKLKDSKLKIIERILDDITQFVVGGESKSRAIVPEFFFDLFRKNRLVKIIF